MERLYSLRQYSSSLNWYFSVCLALLFSQLLFNTFGSTTGHIFLTGILLAIAVDQGLDLLPQWTQRFRKHRAFNLMKAAAFLVLAVPAFAMILKGGFLFTATVGSLAFAFAELLDFLKPYLGELANRHQMSTTVNSIEEPPMPEVVTPMADEPHQERLEKHFRNKVLLVLGSNSPTLVEQLVRYKPAHIILLDNNVERLATLCKVLERDYPDVKVTTHVKIPEHRLQIQHIFERIKPDAILHSAFETNGSILDQNPSYATRVNVVDTIDWVDAARKHGVDEFSLILPTAPEFSIAERCFSIVHRYCQGLQGDAPQHPTRLLLLEEGGESILTQYMQALSHQREVEPPHNFPMFQRAIHQLEWAVTDYNENEVKSLLEALTSSQITEAEAEVA